MGREELMVAKTMEELRAELEARHRFKTGELMRLKSGSPKMAVEEPWCHDDENIRCVWFGDSDSDVMRDVFQHYCPELTD
jgi:uncharacterized protein YodC (DUF2158 family)